MISLFLVQTDRCEILRRVPLPSPYLCLRAFLYAVRTLSIALMVTTSTGCGDRLLTTPASDPHTMLYELSVDQKGLTLAVNDTFQLTAKAVSILGEQIPIPDTLPVRWISNYPAYLTVSTSGLVIAKGSTPYSPALGPDPTLIVASWTYNGVTKMDSIYVAITDTRPEHPAATLSLQPAPYPEDSTWTASIWGWRVVPAAVLSVTGDTLHQAFVYMWSDLRKEKFRELVDPKTHNFSTQISVGTRVWLYGTAVVYGVELRDSVSYTITDLSLSYITVNMESGYTVFNQAGRIVSPCSRILFQNNLDEEIQIVFDDPDATTVCVDGDETGNITSILPRQSAVRKFRISGHYEWQILRANGTPFNPSVAGSVQVRHWSEL